MKYTILIIFTSIQVFSACIPPKVFIKYPDEFKTVGMYQRVHPSGRYILHSSIFFNYQFLSKNLDKSYRWLFNPASVYIFDLKKLNSNGEATAIATPMADESYPVMTDWSLITSPKDYDMQYYSFKHVLKAGRLSHPEFTIKGNVPQYYQSVGELEDNNGVKLIRVKLMTSRFATDYKIKMTKGRADSYEKVKSGKICNNIFQMEEKSKFVSKLHLLRKNLEEEVHRNNTIKGKPWVDDKTNAIQQNITKHTNDLIRKKNYIANLISEFRTFRSPVLSIDGREIAVLMYKATGEDYTDIAETLHIFKINNDYSCDLVDSFDFMTAKVQFSYPVTGKKGKIAFISTQTVHDGMIDEAVVIYDRDLNELKQLTKSGEYDIIGYPGFTLDGRIVFPACKSDSTNNLICGSVILDPNQIEKNNAEVANPVTSCLNDQGMLENLTL